MIIEQIFTYIGIGFVGWVIGKGVESILKKSKKEEKKK